MNALSRRAVLLLLGLVAGTIVSAEVLFTRLLSVSTWYGLAFVVLSLAMLGLASGSLDAAKAQREGAPLAPWIAQRLLAMCAGLVLATLHVHFRDTKHLLDVALQVWFWVTPIVYTVELIPERFRPLVYANPMAAFVEAYHAAVVNGQWPPAALMALLVVLSAVSASVGMLVFAHAEKRFAERV